MKPINYVSLANVDITDGFWKNRTELNRKVTIHRVYDRFKETGRFDALKLSWKVGMKNRPHIFWDSDIAKWVESAAYIVEKNEAKELEALCDEIIDTIEKGQAEDGYFNSYFQTCEPEARFTRRVDHELYCCGHFIEAAVAYYNATGKDKLLKIVCRYVDLIERVFVRERSASFYTPGHEEIELALVKLYHCTGEKKYLELAKHFLDERGMHEDEHGYDASSKNELQDHLPVREMTTAEGHAVRACYLYSAMADIAREYGEARLLDACKTIFANIAGKRMYITGGIGSSKIAEAFTLDYDLPNKTSYTETCAAISLAMFAHRMNTCELNSVYGDVLERVIYNAFPAGVSLDGDSFYYSDPMEISPRLTRRNVSRASCPSEFPKVTRSKVFDCSCCPPNITRFTADIGEYIYYSDDERVVVDQFISSKAKLSLGDSVAEIEQITDYPNDCRVDIRAAGMKGKKLLVRVPGWCEEYSVAVNDSNSEWKEADNGFLEFNVNTDLLYVTFEPEASVCFVEADSRVEECAGKVAVMRGPIVYCMEAVDNGDNIHCISVDTENPDFDVRDDEIMLNVIDVNGVRKTAPDGKLYFKYGEEKTEKVRVRLIPYYCMENRGESEMCVWLNVK